MLARRSFSVDSSRTLPAGMDAASSEATTARDHHTTADDQSDQARAELLTAGPAGTSSTQAKAVAETPVERIVPVHRSDSWYPYVKRVVDVAIAASLLLSLAPLLSIIAILIVLDSRGSPIFRQARIGVGGRTFQMLKFRTMISDRRLRNGGPPEGTPERRRVHKSVRDPRVTRAGRFLRRSCLDELPQLWNVLRGEMSLVGPRPELPHIVATYAPWQHQRHAVTPGITGWWQVNRDQRLMHQATELDLYYIDHRSLQLDVVILTKTLLVVLRGIGAF